MHVYSVMHVQLAVRSVDRGLHAVPDIMHTVWLVFLILTYQDRVSSGRASDQLCLHQHAGKHR